MHFLWKNKFILLNFCLIFIVKVGFSYPGLQFAAVLQDHSLLYSAQDIIQDTNTFRQSLGIAPLKENSTLDIAAAQKLQDMIQNQYFAHFSPDGVSPWHWFEVNQYQYTYAGENLAIGFLGAQDVVDAWEKSPLHRANLVNTHYQEIGVAVQNAKIKDNDGMIVVQLFGTQAASKPRALGIGFSQSGAQGITTTPTPSILPKITKTPAPLIAKVTPIPSPKTAESVSIPAPISTIDTRTSDAGGLVNRIVVIYTLSVALLAVIYLIIRGIRKDLVIKTALHVVIFVAALLIPVLTVSHVGFIL